MSGELKLNVILKLQDFYESKLDSIWLANREDIFLFFCEAINNVIKHAQPPFGNATYVQINLTKQEENYLLEIINDGSEIVNNSREKGGYGTKLMNTIASELPHGNWQRLKTNNQFYVSLNWQIIRV
jgi:two-component sensor histidine kinase